MTIGEFWEQYYRQVLYTLMILVTVLVFVHPIGLPLKVTSNSVKFYDAVEALPPGSIVTIDVKYGGGAWGEVGSANIAFVKHCIKKDLRMVFFSINLEGPLMLEKVLTGAGGKEALGVYGVDWVNLGYMPGVEAALASMMQSPDGWHKTFEYDHYGNKVSTLPLMEDLWDWQDVDLAAEFITGSLLPTVNQWYVPYKTPIVCSAIGANTPETKMYYDAGQVVGYLGSMRGSAEYEKLTGFYGDALSSVEALSLVLSLGAVSIIVGNIEDRWKLSKAGGK